MLVAGLLLIAQPGQRRGFGGIRARRFEMAGNAPLGVVREVMEGDRVQHDAGRAGLRSRRKPGFEPVGGVAPVDPRRIGFGQSERRFELGEALGLVGPDIGDQPLAVSGSGDGIEVDARAADDPDLGFRRRRTLPVAAAA